MTAATSSNVVGASRSNNERSGPPSSWKTPIVSARRSSSNVFSSSSGIVVDVGPVAGRLLDQVERDLDDVEVAQAEEVHLQQAELFDTVHLVLRHHRRVFERGSGLGLALDRQVLGQRFAGDHHRGRVDAVLAAQALEPARDVDDALGVGIDLVERAQVAGHLVAVGETIARRQARVQRQCRGP